MLWQSTLDPSLLSCFLHQEVRVCLHAGLHAPLDCSAFNCHWGTAALVGPEGTVPSSHSRCPWQCVLHRIFFSAHFPWVCPCAGQSGFRSEPWEGSSDRNSGYHLSIFYKNSSWSHKDLHFFLVVYKMFDIVTENHRFRGKAKEFAISQLIQTVSIGWCVGLWGKESCGYDWLGSLQKQREPLADIYNFWLSC